MSETWLAEPEAGWVEIEGQRFILAQSFVSGDASPLAARYYRRGESVMAKVLFGAGTQGPPGCAHGGSIAALLDEIMTWAAWGGGRVAIAADMHVHYRRVLRIPARCIAEATVDRIEGRKVWTAARLLDATSDTLFAEAEGMFVEIDERPFGDTATEWKRVVTRS